MKSNRIVIWGAGYIGLTTAISLAEKGQKTVIYDIDNNKIEKIHRNISPIPNLDYWCGYDFTYWFKNDIIKVSLFDNLFYGNINFIAIPTENKMRPCRSALYDVLHKIMTISKANSNNPIIIIESTLSPGTVDEFILPILNRELGEHNYILCIAPRRDWFVSPDKSLKTLTRIYSCIEATNKKVIDKILGLICKNLIYTYDYRAAEAVKSIENVFRYVDISIANQLAMIFPDLDIVEVLRLAGTKWNLDTYFPSFGIGGYCVPLAAQYLLNSSLKKGDFSIVNAAIKFNEDYIQMLLSAVQISQFKKIGVLGLSYKNDIKVSDGSPCIALVNILKNKYNIKVCVNDPFFTDEEIKKITNCNSFDFPTDLSRFDCIILVTAHRLYNAFGKDNIERKMSKNVTIIDGTGSWKIYFENVKGVRYIRIGMQNWYPHRI